MRHNDPRHGDRSDEFHLIDLGERRVLQHVAQHGSGHRHQRVDRHALRMRHRAERMQETDTVRARLAHADDPAAADVDPCVADILQRLDPVLEGSGRDDVGVIFRRGVDIVVVIVEPGIGELLRLIRRQHAQRHAGFDAHLAHALHHLDELGHVPFLGVAPCGTHAETARTMVLRLRRRLQHGLHIHQLGGLEPAFRFG